MKPSEILKNGLVILGPAGERWTKGWYARDVKGNDVSNVENATCFCGIGAIRVAAFSSLQFPFKQEEWENYLVAARLLNEIAPNNRSWPEYQDVASRTFDEIKAKFSEAIAIAEALEANAA